MRWSARSLGVCDAGLCAGCAAGCCQRSFSASRNDRCPHLPPACPCSGCRARAATASRRTSATSSARVGTEGWVYKAEACMSEVRFSAAIAGTAQGLAVPFACLTMPAGRGKCIDHFCHCKPPYFRCGAWGVDAWRMLRAAPAARAGLGSSTRSAPQKAPHTSHCGPALS